MTSEEIQAEIAAIGQAICTPHEGAGLPHYLTMCRLCTIEHFLMRQRERDAKIATDMAPTFMHKQMREAAEAIAAEILRGGPSQARPSAS